MNDLEALSSTSQSVVFLVTAEGDALKKEEVGVAVAAPNIPVLLSPALVQKFKLDPTRTGYFADTTDQSGDTVDTLFFVSMEDAERYRDFVRGAAALNAHLNVAESPGCSDGGEELTATQLAIVGNEFQVAPDQRFRERLSFMVARNDAGKVTEFWLTRDLAQVRATTEGKEAFERARAFWKQEGAKPESVAKRERTSSQLTDLIQRLRP
jgi:hypothetical protein